MLIEFSVKNFRSIHERQTLSLVAARNSELLHSNTFECGGKLPRVVRSAVIYGPNAAGKSNLLLAAQVAQQIIVGSAIQTQEGQKLPLTPFAFDSDAETEPTEFEFIFAEDGIRYQYSFAATADRVVREWLIAYPVGKPQRWFEREFEANSSDYAWTMGPHFKGDKSQRSTWRNSTRSNALFLSTAVQLNNDQLRPVFLWFQTKLAILTPTNKMNFGLTLELLNDDERRHQLNNFIRSADVGIEALEFRQMSETTSPPSIQINLAAPVGLGSLQRATIKLDQVVSIHRQPGTGKMMPFDFYKSESEGTKKLFEYAGGWIKALKEGATLLVDELDVSLHPSITRFLVKLFQSDEVDSCGAQLVFSTHDTSLLDLDLFRRDQIWFVEKDAGLASHLYPLLQYSPRKDEKLERGYLKGRYGALPFLGAVRF
jgi:hypothetical protein